MSRDAHGAAPPPSPVAGRYHVLSRLGSGGMADVYLARDEDLGRLVAVKVLKEDLAGDATFVERFRIEARAAASLNHPAIVAVYDRGKAGSSPYIVMEYVDGESLKQRLRREGRLPAAEAGAIALAVLSALQTAHEHRIVHRDVTPANVLFDGAGHVKVTDFGIARMGESALTRSGAMLGTSSYLSPEQAQGRPADERSDLYSLGVVLYQMLSGRLPFRGESDVVVAMQHVSAAPPNPRSLAPDVPEAYAAVTMKALSKKPEDRYQSAAEFARALRAAGARDTRAGVVAGSAHDVTRAAGQAPAATVVVRAAGQVKTPAPGPAGPAPVATPRSSSVAEPGRTALRAPAHEGLVATGVEVPASGAAEGGPGGSAAPDATVVAADALTRRLSAARRTEATPQRASRRRRRRHWLAIVVILAAVAAAWVVYAFVLNAGTKVPLVVGRQSAQAAAVLRNQGLKPVLHEVWSDHYDDGLVARQRPRSGTKVDDGVKVDLWVSKGPLHIPAPSLTGLTAKKARATLEQATLIPRKRRSATTSAPKGRVYRQEPAAGETVARGDTVTFWVSKGPPMKKVPDVVGLSSGDAKSALEAAGFAVNTDLVAGWGAFPGHVVDQDPAAGTRLRKGNEVVIKVAVF